MTDFLGAARALRDAGYNPIPIRRGSKIPAGYWRRWQHAPIPDAEYERYWGGEEPYHLGVITDDHHVCLDFDNHPPHDNAGLIDAVVQLASPHRLERTPNGGLHVWLRTDESAARGGTLAAGILDLQAGAGRVVVVAPTPGYDVIHDVPAQIVPNARKYAAELLEAVGGVLPDWRESGGYLPALTGEPIHKGQRSNVLTSLAGVLRMLHFSPAYIHTTLAAIDAEYCDPPLFEGDADGLRELAERIAVRAPTLDRGAGWTIEELAQDTREPNPVAWRVHGMIPSTGVCLIYGDRGSGKSYLADHIAASVATGNPTLSRFAVRPGRVLYLDYEMDRNDFLRRQRWLMRGAGWGSSWPESGLVYINMERPLRDFLPRLRELVHVGEVGLIVVDSLMLAFSGIDINSSDVAKDLLELRGIGPPVLFIHHQSKMQFGENYAAKTPYGSAYLANFSAVIIQTQRIRGDESGMQLKVYLKRSKFGLHWDEMMVSIRGYPNLDERADRVVMEEYNPDTDTEVRARVIAAINTHDDGDGVLLTTITAFGVDDSTARRHLSQLLKDGYIERTGSGTSRYNPYRYRLVEAQESPPSKLD